MGTDGAAAIDVAESAYDVAQPDERWLRQLVERGLPLLDKGCGVVGVAYARNAQGEVALSRIETVAGPVAFAERKIRMMREASPEMMQALTKPGVVGTVSRILRRERGAIELWTRHFDWMQDALGLTAMDPDGQGVVIVAGRPERGDLTPGERRRWQCLSVHFAAGHRIRRGLAGKSDSPLPLASEAVIDPRSFRVTDAVRSARSPEAERRLRASARAIDRARTRLRRTDPERALEIWRGLVDGRWSLVDWFDSDGRRYVVARRNAPELGDPRGLTEREHQVATYAALGESNKLIGYRLGIAPSTVSEHLKLAMRKLGVATKTELVRRLCEFDSGRSLVASNLA